MEYKESDTSTGETGKRSAGFVLKGCPFTSKVSEFWCSPWPWRRVDPVANRLTRGVFLTISI